MYACMYVVIRLHVLMQNNHDVPSIEFVCIYLANSQNSTHYITVVIRLHFLMQNNHVILTIHRICVVIRGEH